MHRLTNAIISLVIEALSKAKLYRHHLSNHLVLLLLLFVTIKKIDYICNINELLYITVPISMSAVWVNYGTKKLEHGQAKSFYNK